MTTRLQALQRKPPSADLPAALKHTTACGHCGIPIDDPEHGIAELGITALVLIFTGFCSVRCADAYESVHALSYVDWHAWDFVFQDLSGGELDSDEVSRLPYLQCPHGKTLLDVLGHD